MAEAIHRLDGGCHCGNIRLELDLSREPAAYNPRACDCDFCTKHSAAYVSDPQGALSIYIEDPARAGRYRQGSEQAEFLLCKGCGVLAAVLYRHEGRLIGAANARAVGGGKAFGPEQAVSPKQLSGTGKVERWRQVWFTQVRITE
jgi:hypothetical protein